MSFGHPLLLLTLLVLPLAWAARLLAERRRMRFAVRFTNVEVLAGVVGPRTRLRLVAPLLLTLALASLGIAVARPHRTEFVPSDKAAVILVLDVSGSMQAEDVKPTRLAAAQRAIHTFLDKVPAHVRVGLILFAGDPVVATQPTTDHDLVGQAVDEAGDVNPFGGTAIGDALALAVQLGRQIAGTSGAQQTTLAERSLAAYRTAAKAQRSPVSILFLSDGHQNRGVLEPLEGAQLAKAAGFPVYTVALGTTGNTTLRGRGGGFFGGGGGFPGGGGFGGGGPNGLAPDPTTLRQIAETTGGEFFRAKTAGSLEDAYAKLGSSLGRARGRTEVTDEFVAGAALLLLLAGVASALWAPRLP
ncbi:MAG TPA: VWA domain-containing protein [Gaiellaceae bacterium]|nr:VWA domain-containing protein [Gaiellaceae bacterium]